MNWYQEEKPTATDVKCQMHGHSVFTLTLSTIAPRISLLHTCWPGCAFGGNRIVTSLNPGGAPLVLLARGWF